MLNLANGFAARGITTDLVLASAKGEFMDRVAPAVRVVDLQSPGVLKSLPRLSSYLRREKPTVLLTAMDYVNALSIVTRALGGGRSTRLFVSCHNSLIDSVRNSPWLRDRLLPRFVRMTYRHADGVIAVSSGVADTVAQVAGIPREKVHVIYNPVVTPEFEREAMQPLAHPWFKEGEPPVILGTGSLTRQKGFDVLVEAFALVRKKANVRLLILGEGSERSALQEQAEKLGVSEDVELHGFVANPYPFMKAARLFVLSSRWEGFGLVLAEAMACGTAVVSTDCPSGPAEILHGGELGALAPVENPERLAEAILSSLNREPERERLRQRAADFSVEKVVRDYIRVMGGGASGEMG
jgi:glycosyltransferase involved in cell wall biosynthesis